MLLLLRQLKRSYLDKKELRKYLLYAVGEMVLIVIGILIALQIDNWNTDKLQKETLKNYLRVIARNIDSDLNSVRTIRTERESAYELSVRWLGFQSRSSTYSTSEVLLASQALSQASTLRHFNATKSGYDALKSSGVLDQMQGTDIELLLYDYYDTVARIAQIEDDNNHYSRLLSMQLWADWPEGFEAWELTNPYVLTTDRFESLQPAYRQLLQDSTTLQLIALPQLAGRLILEYENLDHLGRAIKRLVEIDSTALDENASSIVDGIYDPASEVGYPNLIVDGQVSWKSHYLINSDANDPRVSYEASAAGLQSPYDMNSFRRLGDSVHIEYKGGAAWAGIWLAAGPGISDPRSPDYSMYDNLLLELKGDVGGETIVVNMEDRDDPADGTSTRIELQLSDMWQTYEIDLAEFETADLTILRIPLGFVFLEDPVSFSVRNARFVRAD